MKKMKKVMALLLSLVMVLAMSVVAFADEATKTISVKADDTHTYDVYQIFTGDLTEAGVLSNVKWGINSGKTGAVSDADLKKLTDVNIKPYADQMAAIKPFVNFGSNPIGTVSAGHPCQVASGYYLIKDKGSADMSQDTYSAYIVSVVKDIEIQPKKDIPTFEKKIKDTNDTTGDTTEWQDSADYDIGDRIPFQLKGTVAADYDKYDKYYFAFHDVEEEGLAFDKNTVVVKVDGNKITSGYSVVDGSETGENVEKCTFEVKFANLKQVSGVHAGSVITVEYESVLTEKAVLGEHGNVNKAKLQFSNNPNDSQGGENGPTGETPWDNVIVFTYKVEINKVNENLQPLSGAEFTLSKKLVDGTTEDIAVVKNTAGTSFTFSGLDDGDYILTETTTPSGYNTISPITFSVTADHDITWEKQTRDAVLTKLSGYKVNGEITLTSDKKEGSLRADVENKSGSTLPSTGGMGTTIFYVVGSILVLGAAILLITKKRMSAR